MCIHVCYVFVWNILLLDRFYLTLKRSSCGGQCWFNQGCYVAIGPFSFARVKQVSLTLTWFISRLKYKRECLDKTYVIKVICPT